MSYPAKDNSHATPKGVDKTRRYSWVTVDQPGEMDWLDKNDLRVHQLYQRDRQELQISEITKNWSWTKCGVLIVGLRGGEFWIIDGQQRWCAAMRRSDLRDLPCIVFDTADVEEEARGFLAVNVNRRVVSALDKHRAAIAAKDEAALWLQQSLDSRGIKLVKRPKEPNQTASVEFLSKMAALYRDAYDIVLDEALLLCQESEVPIEKVLLEGLLHLHRGVILGGLAQKEVVIRLHAVGAVRLVASAKRAAAFFAKGGARVYADGMFEELNKGRRKRLPRRGDDGGSA